MSNKQQRHTQQEVETKQQNAGPLHCTNAVRTATTPSPSHHHQPNHTIWPATTSPQTQSAVGVTEVTQRIAGPLDGVNAARIVATSNAPPTNPSTSLGLPQHLHERNQLQACQPQPSSCARDTRATAASAETLWHYRSTRQVAFCGLL